MSAAEFSIGRLEFFSLGAGELLEENVSKGIYGGRARLLTFPQFVQERQVDFSEVVQPWEHPVEHVAQLEVLLQPLDEHLLHHTQR